MSGCDDIGAGDSILSSVSPWLVSLEMWGALCGMITKGLVSLGGRREGMR